MRILVFTGKGGSGASTLAAATACALADAGHRTLAFGLGRGLGYPLDARLGLQPSSIGQNFDALEGHAGLNASDGFRDWLERLLHWRSMDLELAEDIAAMPGVNHIGRLLELQRLAESGRYDAIIVDAAALPQFLDLPAAFDAAARWLERLFAPRQQTVFEPFLRAFAGDYADKGEDVLGSGREMLGRLAALRDTLTDPDIAGVRLVVSADCSALHDLKDAISVLTLFGYRVDAIVANRLFPEEASDLFLSEVRAAQTDALADIKELSQSIALLRANARPASPRGHEALRSFAAELYDGRDPMAFMSKPLQHDIQKEAGRYVLNVALPFASREGLRLEDVDEGIAVHLNGRKCVLNLPSDVPYAQAASWSYDGSTLRVILGS